MPIQLLNSAIKLMLAVLVLCLNVEALAAKAALQVFTEPGVDVYMDNKYVGTTELMQGGLHLDEVSVGEHTIALYKNDSWPQKKVLTIKENEVYRYYTKPFSGNTSAAYTYTKEFSGSGLLTIESFPVDIQVEILNLDIGINKTHEKLVLNGMEEGIHTLVFKWGEKQIRKKILLKSNQSILVRVDMQSGVIQLDGLMHHGEDAEKHTIVLYGD